MTASNTYNTLLDIFPGISVKRYERYKHSLNTIRFEGTKGERMLFTYISPNNYCLRTEHYEREVKR